MRGQRNDELIWLPLDQRGERVRIDVVSLAILGRALFSLTSKYFGFAIAEKDLICANAD